MGLDALTLKRSYRGDCDSLTDNFFIPCLKQSIRYDRAVGFFTSRSFAATASGLLVFLKNGGKMRFVASPLLTLEDIEAIESGAGMKKTVIKQAIILQLDNMAR